MKNRIFFIELLRMSLAKFKDGNMFCRAKNGAIIFTNSRETWADVFMYGMPIDYFCYQKCKMDAQRRMSNVGRKNLLKGSTKKPGKLPPQVSYKTHRQYKQRKHVHKSRTKVAKEQRAKRKIKHRQQRTIELRDNDSDDIDIGYDYIPPMDDDVPFWECDGDIVEYTEESYFDWIYDAYFDDMSHNW